MQSEPDVFEPMLATFDAAADILRVKGLAHLTGDELVEGIEAVLFGLGVNSEDRASQMLRLTEIVSSDVFWKIFHRCWSNCDDTWELNDRLVGFLSFHHADDPARSYMDSEQANFHDSLSKTVRIYRGCAGNRIFGISWTTDKNVAVGFAIGHRGNPVENPVVVSTSIKKADIYTVITGRGESEVVFDPAALKTFSVTAAEHYRR
jgi:hypothetical protein